MLNPPYGIRSSKHYMNFSKLFKNELLVRQGLLKVSREEAKKETFFGYALVAED
jgi:hypothetical protein